MVIPPQEAKKHLDNLWKGSLDQTLNQMLKNLVSNPKVGLGAGHLTYIDISFLIHEARTVIFSSKSQVI